MNKKLIFLDIDGTLTVPGKNVPPDSALKAIRSAQAKGHQVFLASGRNPGMLSPLLKFGFDGYIGGSGAFIMIGEELIKNEPLPEEVKNYLFEKLEGSGCFKTIESRICAYTDESFKDYLREQDEKNNSEQLRWRVQLEKELDIRPMSAYTGEPIFKMMIMHCKRSLLQEIRDHLGSAYQMNIRPGDPDERTGTEVLNASNLKGDALLRVAKELNVPVEDTIAFGDSYNDLEMLRAAGYGVCMENGMDALKKEADYICPAVDQDGLYQAFVRLGLADE